MHPQTKSMSTYSLNSTKTAVAIILPVAQSSDVNTIRSIHDKAFHKWPPHIILLYPSVTIDQLKSALPLCREALLERPIARRNIKTDRIGTFRHRHSCTIFLEPDEESQAFLSELRMKLVKAIGVGARAGTIDGQYRPHMSLGQASLSGDAVDDLVEKCSSLAGLEWKFSALAVLTRLPSGKMEIIDHICFASSSTHTPLLPNLDRVSGSAVIVWAPCSAFETGQSWQPPSQPITDDVPERQQISVLSYNLLAYGLTCAFADRLSLIMYRICFTGRLSEVLCLQEVSSKMLADVLAHTFMQRRYPYCSHNAESLFVNHNSLVALSTLPFSVSVHHFEERHKLALNTRLEDLPFEIVSVHLTAALQNSAVTAKQRQILSLSEC